MKIINNNLSISIKKAYKEGKKMGFRKGSIPWNKNRRCLYLDKNTNGFKKGMKTWNKGLTKETDERIKRIGINGGNSRKGKKQTEKTKSKNRKWQIEHPNRKFSNTKIEQKIAEELTKRGITFQQNKGLKNIANVDFYLPDFNIVIECDGCYYHNCPIHFPEYHKDTRKTDERKTKRLIKEGFKVYRFWEHEINRSAEECVNKIIFLKK